MDKQKDKLIGENIGKWVSLYYNDTFNSVSFKEGKLLDFDETNFKIEDPQLGETFLIPRRKCIRIQLERRLGYAKARA